MRTRHIISSLLVVAALLCSGAVVRAFSLLGPFAPWQTSAIGYNLPGATVEEGGPMDLGEDYRITVPIFTYGFDTSFLTFFGTAGVQAVDNAFAILNSLPSASQINLANYPAGNAALVNFQAQALGVRDLKSTVLSIMVQQLGLADPVRYTWTLHDVAPNANNTATNYWVVRRNFDPVTRFYSSYVNGTLYTYSIRQFTFPLTYTDAVERTSDPAAETDRHLPVASTVPAPGQFFTGLTRDDVGGLKFLLSANRYHVETTDPTVQFRAINPSPWTPVGTTNGIATNGVVIAQGVRGGIEKITFQKLYIDPLLGIPHAVTNTWTDRVRVLTNNYFTNVVVQRVSTNVDILFAAEDLGLVPTTFAPVTITRTAMSFLNQAALNQVPPATPLNGPGQISLGGASAILVSFNRIGEFIVNSNFLNPFLDESNASRSFVWGSFDGSGNPPTLYPDSLSIEALEQQMGLRH